MSHGGSSSDPALRRDGHHGAEIEYGTKLIDKTQKYQEKYQNAKPGKKDDKKEPAGGYDDTPIPKGPPGYTIKVTFHRAENLPFADLPSFSSDPYIMAVFQTKLRQRHKEDPDLKFRTPTIHRNTNPTWDVSWTIAHVPTSGFRMKCRLFDEDPTDHDDRLGNVHVDVDRIDDNWKGFKERKYDIKKRMGSKRAYTIRGCAALLSSNVKMDGAMYVSVENLGKSEGEGGRVYTVSPLPWSQHYSPLIGLIAGTKNKRQSKHGEKSTESYNFQAIQMQLAGPVPEHLYHRYVEFRPFVAGMFTSHSLRGRILNHALHHQHARIYNYDGSTNYGEFEEPSVEMTKKFLDFVNYDKGGRIYTYVITLDGQLRFTETGKEFGIDLLSKHTMHSDVSIYIAFSGEFFIRRLKNANKIKSSSPDPEKNTMPPAPEKEDIHEGDQEKKQQSPSSPDREPHDSLSPPIDEHVSSPGLSSGATRHSRFSWKHRPSSPSSSVHSPGAHAEQTHVSEEPSQDPSHYELIIDNDSGTYRPNAKYLGQLKKFLQRSFPGLRVATLDCQADEEKMNKLKKEQRDRKKKSGEQITYMQNLSDSSLSSSDEEELAHRAQEDNAVQPGPVKSTLDKVKSATKGGQKEANANDKSTNEAASNSKNHQVPYKNSTSTGEKASFDTATEHGDGHFVTPKPSLGAGGLNTIGDDRPLSRGIDDELEKRGLERLSQDDQRPTFASLGDGSSHQKAAGARESFHQAVTSTS